MLLPSQCLTRYVATKLGATIVAPAHLHNARERPSLVLPVGQTPN